MHGIEQIEQEVAAFLAQSHTSEELNALRHRLGDAQERLLACKRQVADAYQAMAKEERRVEDLREKSDEELQAELDRRKKTLTVTVDAPPTFNLKGYEVGGG